MNIHNFSLRMRQHVVMEDGGEASGAQSGASKAAEQAA